MALKLRFLVPLASAMLCLPWFATGLCAQQFAKPERTAPSALQWILDPFSFGDQSRCASSMSAEETRSGVNGGRSLGSQTPGRAPSKNKKKEK